MEDDREDDVVVPVTLDDATLARLQRRGESAGRTVEEQIRYEMEVVFGLTVPDPGIALQSACGAAARTCNLKPT